MGRALLTVLLLASLALVAWPAGRAAAAVNISGFWNLTLLHPDVVGTIACSATIGQGGTNLSASMACDQLGSGTLTGTIDVNTGTFNLSGTLGVNPVSFAGQSALDGNSASGSWVVSPIPANGTFSGIAR